MIRRVLIPLCLCCAILCAFIGYVSQKAIDESASVKTNAEVFQCQALIEDRPLESIGVVIQDYITVDRFAKLDFDDDDQWDEVAIPLFPSQKPKSKAAYQSVIVCFKGVGDREALEKALAKKEVRAEYWASRQKLDDHLKTQLAYSFINMDFENSPVVYVGYSATNPLLGVKSLQLSYLLGGGSLALAALAFLFSVVVSLFNRKPKFRPEPPKPKNNLAGLPKTGDEPKELTGGVLDKVRSMRDPQPET